MTLTDQEKIQKAEEIYYRRNGMGYREAKKDRKEPQKHTFRNLVVILVIICGIYGYENKDFVVSTQVQTQIKEFLNTKINIKEIFSTEIKQNNTITTEKNEIKQETTIDEKQAIVDESQPEVKEETKLEVQQEVSQMPEVITPVYEIIWPHIGEITSEFGSRSSSDKRVTSNHTGIDIAGNQGDKIKSAMNGTVVQVSEEGALGKHIKIENGETATVYAHCNSIYVSEGQEILQGQEIGEVGSTGNSTGNHLHFEVIKSGEYIDPLAVIEK